MIKAEVKQSIIQGLDYSELITISLPHSRKHELHWEHETEFEFRGKKYDVVETRHTGDSLNFICWEDEKESAIEKELHSLLALRLGNDPAKNKRDVSFRDFCKNLILQFSPPQLLMNFKNDIVLTAFDMPLLSLKLNPDSPPPRL